MILDPRFKLQLIEEQNRLTEKEKLNKIYKEYENNFKKNENQQNIKTEEEKQNEKKNNDDSSESDYYEFPKSNDEEINSYLLFPVLGKDEDILNWWNLQSKNFPILSQMASDYLSIQISSVSVEQLFSEAGEIVTKKRNRLNDDTIKELICLDNWIDLEFD